MTFGSAFHPTSRRPGAGPRAESLAGLAAEAGRALGELLLRGELAEEAPHAYKDVDRVVDAVSRAGLARKVARLVPLGVVKG